MRCRIFGCNWVMATPFSTRPGYHSARPCPRGDASPSATVGHSFRTEGEPAPAGRLRALAAEGVPSGARRLHPEVLTMIRPTQIPAARHPAAPSRRPPPSPLRRRRSAGAGRPPRRRLDPARRRPGPRLLRGPDHGAPGGQRLDLHHRRAAGGAGLLLRHLRQRRLGPGGPGDHRPRPHVRAHGVQGHDHHRHHRLGGREEGARRRGGRLPGLAGRAAGRAPRPSQARRAVEGLPGAPGRGRRRSSSPAPSTRSSTAPAASA